MMAHPPRPPIHTVLPLILGSALALLTAPPATAGADTGRETADALPADAALSCAQLQDKVDELMEQLGAQARLLGGTLEEVQATNAAGTKRVKEAVRKTQQSQMAGVVASGIGEILPGAGVVAGLAGSAVTAASAVDHAKFAAEQARSAEAMRDQMARMAEQANATMPGALRLQQLNALQASKGCNG